VLQQLNDSESPQLTDEWMRFSCWRSSEKQWKEDNLSIAAMELFLKIDNFVKREAASNDIAQNVALSDDVTVDVPPKPSKLLFVDTTLERLTLDVYPRSTAIFGLKHVTSVLQLASLGLSDDDIVQRVADHSKCEV
jgi:hypothetical protein